MRSFSSYNFSLHSPDYAFGLCALFIAYINTRGPCVSLSLEVGNRVVTLSYSEAKYQKYLLCGSISLGNVVFSPFSLKSSRVHAGYKLCCMFVFLCLGVLRKVKRVLAFPKFLGLIPVAI